ncbi:Metallophosphoesterase [Azoarcus sp. CIB]|uniref:metallophosphoesterase n=1 Tax=Aromatoleum sp. (strain CIB) TaxID=198107 RepID=UPI00067AA3B4|nr:metallophosphoesterase [Azoarcus sp. CIB]AKU11646.1 Metallophosphoesterase [Azoarcus sp. CIB]
MRLYIASDIHLEFGERWMPSDLDYDVLVLAGDVHSSTKGFKLFRGWMGRWMIYVAGNHEFYGRNMPATVRQLQGLGAEAERDGSFFLEKSSTVIDGVRFLGTTLWTDFELFGADRRSEAMDAAEGQMTDYFKIVILKDGPTAVLLAPSDTRRLHAYARDWLAHELARPHDGPTVVVTHHAPSMQSIAQRFRDDLVTAAYASNLEALIQEHQPALWIHGHTHVACDYNIGSTRILANPKGYPSELATGFRQNLIVQV